jgi:hypothetical protein
MVGFLHDAMLLRSHDHRRKAFAVPCDYGCLLLACGADLAGRDSLGFQEIPAMMTCPECGGEYRDGFAAE